MPLPPLGQPPTAILPTGQVKEYELTLSYDEWEIRPGVVVEDATMYNGSVPGPTIRAMEGDLVRVLLRNQLKEPTTIHWHGLRIPNNMDGVPPFSQTEVEPGGEFVYEFIAPKAGTYMYHPHGSMHLKQIDRGAYGFVVIDPADRREPQYDREYTLMMSTWTVEGAGGMEDMGYNVYTINGKTYPDIVLDVEEGEHIRVRIGNLSAALAHPMHLHGHDFRVIAKDGYPLVQPYYANTILVAPGETYDVDFYADNPGIWIWHCHNLHHLPDMTIIVRYNGFDLPTVERNDDGMTMDTGSKQVDPSITKLAEEILRQTKF